MYCAEDVGARPALHLGEQNSTSSLQQLSSDQLFVSDDTSEFPAGCSLLGQIDNGIDGKSEPVELAHLRRFPQVTSFIPIGTAASDLQANTLAQEHPMRMFELRGLNLEMIERLGWASNTGEVVTSLPTPIPNMGQQQSLMISLPEPPSPKSTLYIWLRGETTGRASTISLNVPSAAL